MQIDDLIQDISQLDDVSYKLVCMQVARLRAGNLQYGPWSNDNRDMLSETLEEFLDATQYMMARLLQIKDKNDEM